ncbi:MAG: hypothetical protein Q7S55_05230 [Nanoarchaeota archaeon]|nr:hypothetical protein [Nanoarchaeota archaeon]
MEPNTETVVLYSVCNKELYINAEYIAWQYDCEIEYRESQFSEAGLMSFFPSYLRSKGIDPETKKGLSAVLIGEDREKLYNARDYIYETLGVGVTPFRAGSIRVGYRKIDFPFF